MQGFFFLSGQLTSAGEANKGQHNYNMCNYRIHQIKGENNSGPSFG